MKTELDEATLEQWLDQFKKAAILFHRGQYLAVKTIEKAGADACNALVREIVAGHVRGRDVLLPLLHDQEPYVQVSAAQYLVTEHPEIVVPILFRNTIRPARTSRHSVRYGSMRMVGI